MPASLIPLVLTGGQLPGARYLKIAQLALEALTATRKRQREIDRELVPAIEEARRESVRPDWRDPDAA